MLDHSRAFNSTGLCIKARIRQGEATAQGLPLRSGAFEKAGAERVCCIAVPVGSTSVLALGDVKSVLDLGRCTDNAAILHVLGLWCILERPCILRPEQSTPPIGIF